MSGDFIDSNVILYAFDVDERKYRISRHLLEDALASNTVISFQVVQEVLNVLLRRSETTPIGTEPSSVLDGILAPLWRVMPSRQLYEAALRIQTRYSYSFYDSLIIAAALEAGSDRLLTEDLQDGQRIEGLTIVNPFV